MITAQTAGSVRAGIAAKRWAGGSFAIWRFATRGVLVVAVSLIVSDGVSALGVSRSDFSFWKRSVPIDGLLSRLVELPTRSRWCSRCQP